MKSNFTTAIIFALTISLLASSCGSGSENEGPPDENIFSIQEIASEIAANPAGNEPESNPADELEAEKPEANEPLKNATDNNEAEEAGGDWMAEVIGSAVMRLPERGTLRIATLHHDASATSFAMIHTAKKKFENKFPGWEVVVEEYARRGEVSNAELERYLTDLPERLRHFDEYGIDLIRMDYTDRPLLLREGLLEDMAPYFSGPFQDFDLNSILPGVLSAIGTLPYIYIMPTAFSFDGLNVYAENASLSKTDGGLPYPWDFDAALDFFRPEKERLGLDYMLPMPPQRFLSMIFGDYYPYFYDFAEEKYDFDSIVFRELLQIVKLYHDEEMFWDIDFEDEFWYGLPGGLLLLMTPSFDQLKNYQEYETYGNVSQGIYPLPRVYGSEGIAIRRMNEFAMNANAPNKAAAWEFMMILLSDEIQVRQYQWEQPVLATLSEASVKLVLGETSNLTETRYNNYNDGRQAFFSKINRVTGREDAPFVWNIIEEHALRYFKGEVSLESAIRELQEAVEEYLRE